MRYVQGETVYKQEEKEEEDEENNDLEEEKIDMESEYQP